MGRMVMLGDIPAGPTVLKGGRSQRASVALDSPGGRGV